MGSTAEDLLDLLPKTLDRLGGQLDLALLSSAAEFPTFIPKMCDTLCTMFRSAIGRPLVNSGKLLLGAYVVEHE